MKIAHVFFSFLFMTSLFSCSGIRNKFTFFPDTESKIARESLPDYISEENILTIDNERLQAFLFKHNDSIKHPLVIYFHGNAGNLYHRFGDAHRLYDMNQNVLLVSYRGYASSSGKASEKGIYIDGEATLQYAKDHLGYPESNIILYGRSLGSAVAINTAQNKLLKAIVLVTPLTSGKEMAQAMGLGLFKFIAGGSFNSTEKINRLKSRLLIIHGDEDELVPYAMGQKLYNEYNGPKKMITIKGGKHNDLQDVDSNLYWKSIEEFITEKTTK